jgi:UDP-N-acetylmuramoyl-tripeptide--D-alanyl-D-alanine ligase
MVIKKNLDRLYSEEISPATSPEYAEYVHLNLKKIKEFRKNFQIPVIGVAGSDGKTTTMGMLSAILGQRGKILQTPLDCDSASIVSSTLLHLNNDYSYCLIEMGIFNQEQFKLAVEMSQPDIGIVTNIGEAHLAKLGDKYIIANANVELIRHLKTDGYAVLNIDDELVSEMENFAGTQRILKFGFNHAAHFHATKIQYLGPDGMMFLVNNYYKFHLPIYSSTSVSNALAAIATARILNFEFDEIQNGLKHHFKVIPGRGDFIELGDIFILDHTYNATINSVTKACESLVQFKNFSKNLILVIGSMDELGEKTINVHKNIGYYISALPIDIVITIGQDASYIAEGIRQINHNKKLVYHCETAEQLPQKLFNQLSPHTTILITGGKSLNLKDYLAKIVAKIKPSSAKTIKKTELSVNS